MKQRKSLYPLWAFAFSSLLLIVSACSRSTIGRLVGSDRDDHGCLTSDGYQWSNALHDCVRVWEVGERFDEGEKPVFLVYSRDSLFAEIFLDGKQPVLCKRVKGTQKWQALKGKQRVFVSNGITTIQGGDYNYTRKVGRSKMEY